MPEIRLLDSSVINLIAAGEVVDRPASAVKELVENAIDAGADRILVEIRRGGLGMIRITDNGCGMSAENAKKAFLKHATSKIAGEDDLNQIKTLGFRGEALAAISAVSKITLTTKEAGKTAGTRLEVSEGEILSEEECGCPEGSCFTIQDLFFNTPARLKFMKSEPAETGAVQSVMERLALSHPQISFHFSVNGAERFHTPGNGDLKQTVFSVFAREFAEMSLPAETTIGDIRVSGLVGKPIYSKANRSRQIFFLNGRYVRSPILTAGLESAYHNKMLIGRMPVCVLFIEMPFSQVDVNVHPSKLEVKFADENAVSYAVRKAAENALNSDNGIVEIKIPQQSQPIPREISPIKANPYKKVPEPKPFVQFEEKKAQIPQPATKILTETSEKQPVKKETVLSEKSGWVITVPAEKPENKVVFKDVAPNLSATVTKSEPFIPFFPPETPKPKVPERKDFTASKMKEAKEEPVLFQTEAPFRIIGESFDCYILVERKDEILFIDKHALHERMNFERLRKSDVPAQTLLHPIVLHIGIDENRILTENADFLSRFGFILESFGEDLIVREIPALISPEQTEPLLQQFADSLTIGKDDSLLDKFYYDLACKASVRSGSKTTLPELEGLVAEYFKREDELQYCPHGRPIVFSLSKKSIEKQFKR